jgi:hypothetical protein
MWVGMAPEFETEDAAELVEVVGRTAPPLVELLPPEVMVLEVVLLAPEAVLLAPEVLVLEVVVADVVMLLLLVGGVARPVVELMV